MNAEQQRKIVTDQLEQYIDATVEKGELGILDVVVGGGRLAAVVLILPAPLGQKVADAIEAEWRRCGGIVNDVR